MVGNVLKSRTHRDSDALGMPLRHSIDMQLGEDGVRRGTSEQRACSDGKLHIEEGPCKSLATTRQS